ncbi:MAG: response regulator transcription factor, partial [Muribaculaceae bacterium]|nr:response regulator transcription factor [Muribaculaceae bacterium]
VEWFGDIVFNIGEVLARVRAVLRRAKAAENRSKTVTEAQQSIYETDVTFKGLRIDRNDKECYLNNELVTLTRTEFDILLFFLTHRNRIYSREEIIKNVWGDDVVVTERTIDTNITRLRKKLGDYDKYIVTRQGFGYGFKEKD